jgi:hypothetical protein
MAIEKYAPSNKVKTHGIRDLDTMAFEQCFMEGEKDTADSLE